MNFEELRERVSPYLCAAVHGLFILAALLIVAACQDIGDQDNGATDTSDDGGSDTEMTADDPVETMERDEPGADDNDNSMTGGTEEDADMAGDEPAGTMDSNGIGDGSVDDRDMHDGMMALGGTAQSDVLAEGQIDPDSSGPLRWVAFEHVASDGVRDGYSI